MLTRRLGKIVLAVALLGILADAAWASFLPGPFAFTFFTPTLNNLVLLPLQIAGCGP